MITGAIITTILVVIIVVQFIKKRLRKIDEEEKNRLDKMKKNNKTLQSIERKLELLDSIQTFSNN